VTLYAEALMSTTVDTPLDLFEILTKRPAWHADAACRETPAVNFFPDRGEPVGPALAVCAGCLVRSECRAYALGQPLAEVQGVWGGTTGRSREKLRRAR
jgi:hypothetical protein